MKKRICVLEDTEEILEIIKIVLEEEQYEVFGFGTVSEFTGNLNHISPDLCLLDVMLPDGNGLDVCRDIKSAENTKHIPIIIMTANSQIEKMKNECSADDFLAKPFDINVLTDKISRLVNDNSLQTLS